MRYVGTALIAALSFVACGGNDAAEAFCGVAQEVQETDTSNPDIDEVRRLTEDLREAAPDEIQEEAQTFAEGIERLSQGDTSALTEEFNEAADRIGEYGEENCDFE